MAGFAYDPLLKDHLPTGVIIEGAVVSSATGYPAVLNGHLQGGVRGLPKLRDDLIPVVRVHRRVVIPMEYNRRDGA